MTNASSGTGKGWLASLFTSAAGFRCPSFQLHSAEIAPFERMADLSPSFKSAAPGGGPGNARTTSPGDTEVGPLSAAIISSDAPIKAVAAINRTENLNNVDAFMGRSHKPSAKRRKRRVKPPIAAQGPDTSFGILFAAGSIHSPESSAP